MVSKRVEKLLNSSVEKVTGVRLQGEGLQLVVLWPPESPFHS